MNVRRLIDLLQEALIILEDEDGDEQTPVVQKGKSFGNCKYTILGETDKALRVDFIEPSVKLGQWIPKGMLANRESQGLGVETGVLPKWLLKEKNLI